VASLSSDMNPWLRVLVATATACFAHATTSQEPHVDVTIEATALLRNDSPRSIVELEPVIHDGTFVGLQVTTCSFGSWCSRMGLQRGNIITHVNGRPPAPDWKPSGAVVLRVCGVDPDIRVHVD
jgi:hypothetical protein